MNKEEELKKLEEKTKKELENCELLKTAKNIVFGKGDPTAKVMLIGEAPGKKEDEEGKPFVGAAGKELDKLLQKANLKKTYIANILKIRPPNNRDPTIKEIKKHTPYLKEQIRIINPDVIITLGNYATKYILSNFNPEEMKNQPGITKIHGKEIIKKINKKEVRIIPSYHPAAMLYNPKLRKIIEEDFKKINEKQKKLEEYK